MGKGKEIDKSNSEDPGLTFDEESEDTIKEVPDETDDAVKKVLDGNGSDRGKDAPLAANHIRTDRANKDVNTDETKQKIEPLPGGDSSSISDESKKELAPKITKGSKVQKSTGKLPSVKKIISAALIILIVAGFIFYYNPSLIGIVKEKPPTTAPPIDALEPVTPVPQQAVTPSPPSKHDQCVAKLEEAVRLRDELLKKNTEISELKLYYHTGIAELEAEIYQKIRKKGISSFKEAMKNKRLELNMRTIQRRQAYIKELVKPVYWLNSGSEELLFLVRKTQFEMQLSDIAGGIDLNKHMGHIDAAIRKYRPSPDKLAIDPLKAKVPPLEKIWQQVSNREDKKERLSLNPKNKIITNQVCSGNFEHIAELTSISPGAAKCLSQMQGSDLFLNGLTTLSPDAAKQLFQWQGNWICLNGVKHLSPTTAQYLFQWEGKWISLNSLNEFPAELAVYLLKWEGQQLELMGLEYNKNEENQKALKYLALWETTGGKLFVTDKIRQEMKKLM